MTEETKTETEKPAEKPPETEQPKARHPGYEPVDFDALGLTPEQRAAVEPRVRYLYGNLKAGEKERELLRRHNDDLQKAIDERLASLETAKKQEDDVRITAAIKNARDVGDVETETRLLKELVKPEPPKPQKQDPVAPYKPGLEAWAAEVDHEGNLRRPWLQEDHPEHEVALGKLHRLHQEWTRQGMEVSPNTLPVFLNQLDSRMVKTNGQARTAAVLPTGQIKPPDKKQTELTQEQMFYADKMLGHYKKPEERYAAYAKQIALMGRK